MFLSLFIWPFVHPSIHPSIHSIHPHPLETCGYHFSFLQKLYKNTRSSSLVYSFMCVCQCSHFSIRRLKLKSSSDNNSIIFTAKGKKMSTVFILSLSLCSTAMSMLYGTKLDFKQQIPWNIFRIHTERFDKVACFLAIKGREKSAERWYETRKHSAGGKLKYHTEERIKASVCIIKFATNVFSNISSTLNSCKSNSVHSFYYQQLHLEMLSYGSVLAGEQVCQRGFLLTELVQQS